jgi:hypothetical protein
MSDAMPSNPLRAESALLFLAHPGHELLLRGWIARIKPRTCVLTDGSGYDNASRIGRTEETLRSLRAPIGRIFGPLADRDVYAAILEGDRDLFDSLVTALMEEMVAYRVEVVVADAAEGFNPAHDLCRALVGAACVLSAHRGVDVHHYEYPIHAGPGAYDDVDDVGDVLHHRLDDEELAAKLAAAHDSAAIIPDISPMLSQFGEESFRHESFRRVDDWTASGWSPGERPLYEQIGRQRVRSGRYEQVIRYEDHIRPLVEYLRDRVAAASCAS